GTDMVEIRTRQFNSGGQSPPEEGHFDPFATEAGSSDGNIPPRTFTPEEIAAAREDNDRYMEAELERADRPALPDVDADVDDAAGAGGVHPPDTPPSRPAQEASGKPATPWSASLRRLAAELERGSRLRRRVQQATCPPDVRSHDFEDLKWDIEY